MKNPVLAGIDDLIFLMTEKCNSNCIMCPMSLSSRKNAQNYSPEEWLSAFEDLPESINHITITGGEPFCESARLFYLMDFINYNFPASNVLILTNGRALAIDEIFSQTSKRLSARYRLAVPLHASNSELHDFITQSHGSFEQTLRGLQNLKHTDSEIEIRIVLHKLNMNDVDKICRMLAESDFRITQVVFTAMEMNGCAAANRNNLWVDYRTLYDSISEGIIYLIQHKINLCLYNFPLCSLPYNAWPLAKKSISPEKVRFYDGCSQCAVKDACSGLFVSTYNLKLFRPEVIKAREKS